MSNEDYIEHKGELYTKVEYEYMMRKAARNRERYRTDPEYRERHIEAAKKWAKENREKRNAYNREWMRRKREQSRETLLPAREI